MTEDQLAKQVKNWLDIVAKGKVFWFHVPNEGKRGWRAQKQFKDCGGRAGVPDLVFCFEGRFAAIELKAGKNTCTDDQNACIGMIREAGGSVAVCRSLDEVIGTLKAWGVK